MRTTVEIEDCCAWKCHEKWYFGKVAAIKGFTAEVIDTMGAEWIIPLDELCLI